MQTVYPKVTIRHNHGVRILENATVVKQDGKTYIKGICVGGGETSRLFTATSYTEFQTGTQHIENIGSSKVVNTGGWTGADGVTRPDCWTVDITFC